MLKDPGGVIVLLVYVKGLGILGKAGGIFDVIDVVPETLQADDVMEVLPDDAGDGAPAHEAHDDEALFFHG